jgi:hypothetical protein
MLVDIEHVLFWMDAIRNSNDKFRTLESFWKGQVRSKIWLIENLMPYMSAEENKIVVHGGWNGILSSLMFQTNIMIDKIVSVDIDSTCEEIAKTVNKIEEIEGRFSAVTCDMVDYQYEFSPNIVINTSCEHITQESYDKWLRNIPENTIIVLQSNDYYELDEHIRCVSNIDEFKKQSNLNIIFSSKLELPLYNRFLLIGTR